MNSDFIICGVLAGLSLLYALASSLRLLYTHHHTGTTTGTIVSIARLPNPNANTHLNAHWAQVTYTVNGRTLVSENRVQVARTAVIGSNVRVRYDSVHPTRLRQTSLRHSLIALVVGIVLLVLAMLLY